MLGNILNKMIFDLLQYRRSTERATKQFRKLEHNKDLCPAVQKKLEDILTTFEKYQKITYDIQGIRDNGTDVLLKRTHEESSHFICFQIKNDKDLLKKDYLKLLKSQCFDTESCFSELEAYYILLCCSIMNKKTKEKIRNIEAEFKNKNKVWIIEPQFSMSFLKLTSYQIDGLIRNKIGSDDIVYKKAFDSVALLTPTEKAVLFFLLQKQIYNKRKSMPFKIISESKFLRNVYSKTLDYVREWYFMNEEEVKDAKYIGRSLKYRKRDFEARLLQDLEYLIDREIEMNNSDEYFINVENNAALSVFLMDGAIRYEYENDDLLNYMMELFGILKGYDNQKGISVNISMKT